MGEQLYNNRKEKMRLTYLDLFRKRGMKAIYPSFVLQPILGAVRAASEANNHSMGEWYRNQSEYRQYGLRFEDLLVEDPVVEEAIRRLPAHEKYGRDMRKKRALDCQVKGKVVKILLIIINNNNNNKRTII